MRKIVSFGVVVVVGALLVAILTGRLPRVATASQTDAIGFMDVHALEGPVDLKALPRQDLPPGTYE